MKLFVKPLNHFIIGFDAIATYAWVDWNSPFSRQIFVCNTEYTSYMKHI